MVFLPFIVLAPFPPAILVTFDPNEYQGSSSTKVLRLGGAGRGAVREEIG